MINEISIITTHFHDFDWTELLLEKVFNFTDFSKIKEILIINQDRNLESANRLRSYSSKIRVVQYPRSEKHFEVQGHDHAAVLNKAITEVKGKYICIFDSDAHPINRGWIKTCETLFNRYDALLAVAPDKLIETHPCFMFIRKENDPLPISFDDQLFESKADTGRLVGQQLSQNGLRVYLIPPARAFNGYFGYIYLNMIYHHRNASFYGAEDERIKQQFTWKNEYFKKLILKKNLYEFTFYEFVKYKTIGRLYRILSLITKRK